MMVKRLRPMKTLITGSNMIFVTKNNNVKNHVPGYFTPPSKPPSEFNDTIFRSSMKQVLPL